VQYLLIVPVGPSVERTRDEGEATSVHPRGAVTWRRQVQKQVSLPHAKDEALVKHRGWVEST